MKVYGQLSLRNYVIVNLKWRNQGMKTITRIAFLYRGKNLWCGVAPSGNQQEMHMLTFNQTVPAQAMATKWPCG